MLPYPTVAKKSDVINGAIILFATKYDVDSYPVFNNKRDMKKVLKWMTIYKMSKQDVFVMLAAYTLTYEKSAAPLTRPSA
jgi:hypothetical protein